VQNLDLTIHFGRLLSPFWMASVLESFMSQAGASFSGGTLGARILRQTRVVGSATKDAPPIRRAGLNLIDCTTSEAPMSTGKR
jgi:hypothetical protein